MNDEQDNEELMKEPPTFSPETEVPEPQAAAQEEAPSEGPQEKKTHALNRRFDEVLRREFVEALAQEGIIAAACASVGVSDQTVLNHRKANPEFDHDVKEAKVRYLQTLRAAAKKQAIHGFVTERTSEIREDGVEVVKEKLSPSPQLLIKLLMRHDKKMVDTRSEAKTDNVNRNENVQKQEIEFKSALKKLSKDDRETLRRLMTKLGGNDGQKAEEHDEAERDD